MDSVKEYLLSVTAAALLCSVLLGITGSGGTQGKLLRLICGCFVALAVISPLRTGVLQGLFPDLNLCRQEAEQLVAEAEEEAAAQRKAIIKQQAEAYIGNKAAAMNCALSVSVTLATQPPYAPVAVELRGEISPSAKRELSQWLQDNFGLAGEEQVWRSS